MTPTNAASRSKRGAAARSEVNGKGRTIKLKDPLLKDLKLSGPPELPATFSWDYAELQSLARDEDEGVMGTLYDLIISIFGREQARLIRNRIAEKAPTTSDAGIALMSSIIDGIMESYGTTPGES